MAFGAKQISPIDFNKSAAVGVDLPFSAPGVFKSNYTTAAATKNNLINFFLTNQGERPLNPTFGAGLRAFIFEQIVDDNLDFLKENIQDSINSFFPDIIVNDLSINKLSDSNLINVSLSYSVVNRGINDNINLEFE